MRTETFISTSVDETYKIAGDLIKSLENKKTNIFINGELGAGKTHFVKGIFKALGFEKSPTSPTYDLVINYEINNLKVNHLDLYRIETLNLEDEIWINQILEEEALNIIEWGNKFNFDNLEKAKIEITIFNLGENERKIEIHYN